jgi:nucleoside-diphosphate-sugar epimerase
MINDGLPQGGAGEVRRIAVTGASGFIGQHLLFHLKRLGLDAVALSRSGTSVDGVKNVTIRDYGDESALDNALQGIDVVIHLAARAHQLNEDQREASVLYYDANVRTAEAVAKACRRANVRRFVLMSSIGVNGNVTHGRAFGVEDAPAPVEEYACSKLAAEKAIADTLREGSTDFVIIRPPLVYGPHCPGNFERLLRLVTKLPVIPLGGLKSLRTFVCVDNLVDALVVASRHPGVSRKTFLVADTEDISVGNLIRYLAEGAGKSHWAVWNIPSVWLETLARVAGKQATFAKLAQELRVDGSAFCRTTGWVPPVKARVGLRVTAQAFSSRSR